MAAAQQIAEVVDFEDYRRRRVRAERAMTMQAAPITTPIAFTFFWMPVIVFVPVWRFG